MNYAKSELSRNCTNPGSIPDLGGRTLKTKAVNKHSPGPGTLVLSGGSCIHVTPVDGFTVAVRASGVTVPEPRAEGNRTVLAGFRDWYRRFDRSSAPARRPARSGRSGRRRERR